MQKNVTIGNKEIALSANAATPIEYQSETGRDFFKDIAPFLSGKSNIDYIVLANMTYIMAKDGSNDENFPATVEEWLGQFDGMIDLVNATADIIEMWSSSTKTTVKSKKKDVRQNDQKQQP